MDVATSTRFIHGRRYVISTYDTTKLILLCSAYLIINAGMSAFNRQPLFSSIVFAASPLLIIAFCVYFLTKHISDGNISGSDLVSQFIAGAAHYSILKYFLHWVIFFTSMTIIGVVAAAAIPFFLRIAPNAIAEMSPNVSTIGPEPFDANWQPDGVDTIHFDYKRSELFKKLALKFIEIVNQAKEKGHPLRKLLFWTLSYGFFFVLSVFAITPVIIILWYVHQRHKRLNKTARSPGTTLTTRGMVLHAIIGGLGVLATALCLGTELDFIDRRSHLVYSIFDLLVLIVIYIGSQTFLALEDAEEVVFDRPNNVLRMAGKLVLFTAFVHTLRRPVNFSSCFLRATCYVSLLQMCFRLGAVVWFGIRSWRRFRVATGEELVISRVS